MIKFKKDFNLRYLNFFLTIEVVKGCWGIIFTHGVQMGGWAVGKSLSGLYLRNHKL